MIYARISSDLPEAPWIKINAVKDKDGKIWEHCMRWDIEDLISGEKKGRYCQLRLREYNA